MPLEAFTERVREIATNAYSTWTGLNLNESVVRQVIVLPLLQAAGFDIWNPLEVYPERTNTGGRRADLAIDLDGRPQFFIELKGYSISLAPQEIDQAVAYAGSAGVRWAFLTNGRHWKVADQSLFHLPNSDRVVLELDLSIEEAENFAQDLYRLLNKDVWASGDFDSVWREVKASLDRRLEDRNIILEKIGELASFARDNTINDLGKAVELMARLGLLTDRERDVLLLSQGGVLPSAPTSGNSAESSSFLQDRVNAYHRMTDSSGLTIVSLGEATALICEGRGARATARLLEDGSLEVQSGSTASNNPTPGFGGAQAWQRRRDEWLQSGRLRLRDDGLLEYLEPVRYSTATAAAVAILAVSVNGRDAWKTEDGRTYAQLHPSS